MICPSVCRTGYKKQKCKKNVRKGFVIFYLDFRYNFPNINIISKSFATYGCCHPCLFKMYVTSLGENGMSLDKDKSSDRYKMTPAALTAFGRRYARAFQHAPTFKFVLGN